MTTYVVDASVAAAAILQEDLTSEARGLLEGPHHLLAPDFIYLELANVIWKRHRRGEISPGDAEELLADAQGLALVVRPCGSLVEEALRLAMQSGRTVYDCLYLALAIQTGSVLATADQRLVNALAATPLARYLAWIGDRH